MSDPRRRILVVEDQRIVAADIEKTLARLGYDAAGIASSGEEAMQKASELRPDLVLMDIRLQGRMDGIHVAQVVRERLDVPVVFLTAYADEETVQRAKATGPFGYIVKPFNERELRSVLEISLYRHETDRLLRRRERWYSTTLGAIGDAVITIDAAAAVSFLNGAAEALTGWKLTEARGRPLLEMCPLESPAGEPLTSELLERALRSGGTPVPEQTVVVTRDRRRVPVNGSAAGIVDDREVYGTVVVLRDASASKQSGEARVRVAEEDARSRAIEEEWRRFRLLIQSVRDYAIVMLDPEGLISSWSPGAERITGYDTKEIIGKHFSTLYGPEDLASDTPARDLRQAIELGGVEHEGWRVRKDGSRYWASVLTTELRDDRGTLGFTMVIRDLSYRKRLEDQQRFLDRATTTLASSLDLSVALQQACRLAVSELADCCIIDLEDVEKGQLVQVAAAHISPPKEELARQLGRVLPGHPEPQRGAWNVFKTGRPESYPELTDDAWAASLLGSEHPELLRQLGVRSYMAVPISAHGRTLGVLNLVRGSPPRRYSAEDLSLAEEFARRAGMAIGNARFYRQAQEAVRAREEFLAIASHELRTPLMPLHLQLDTLRRLLEQAGVLTKPLEEIVDRAARQTTRLDRLVGLLLDVSTIAAGKLAISPEELDLSELVRDVVSRFRAEADAVGCSLELRAPTPLMGRWDRTRLEQVLSNLLSNAIKYGPGKPVEVEVRESGDMVELEIRDHGIGIDEEALRLIFDRFERAASVRNYGGLGLGLYIARQIVDAHGGSIQARSQRGVGASFAVRLPRQAIARVDAHAFEVPETIDAAAHDPRRGR